MRELLEHMTRDLKAEIVEANHENLSVVGSLAGNVGRYKRERNRSLKAVISEICSAARNIAAIKWPPELRLIPGARCPLRPMAGKTRLCVLHVLHHQ